ncbi:MAG: YjzD family protein [Aerococcaceae bacterium]|nr:YjzD family protein [Aerococcaceae bacterium]
MKYVMTLFWSLILGHVVYYLGSSLTNSLLKGHYDLVPGTLLGVAVTVAVIILAHIMKGVQNPTPNTTQKTPH